MNAQQARLGLRVMLKRVIRELERLYGAEQKTVAKRVDDYEVDLSEMVVDVLNGDAAASKLGAKLRALIRRAAPEMGLEALEEAGSGDPAADYDDAVTAIVDGWIADQLDYVDGFVADTGAATRANAGDEWEARQASIIDRVTLWAGSLANLGAKVKADYLANKPGTWVYGDTDHCDTCQKLNGQRHRLRWFTERGFIPQQNGSETLECGGWRCQCTIVDDEGNQLLP